MLSTNMPGFEPELVLVIEIAGRVADFLRAVKATTGMEWLGEWELDAIEPDAEFYQNPEVGVNFFKQRIAEVDAEQSREIQQYLRAIDYIDSNGKIIGEQLVFTDVPANIAPLQEAITEAIVAARKEKPVGGQVYLTMSNQQGMDELVALHRQWQQGQQLPRGKANWAKVFARIVRIRRWGIRETLIETGMLEAWRDLLDNADPTQEVPFQIELFYGSDNYRKRNEQQLQQLLKALGGRITGQPKFLDMKAIAFHAAKAVLPAARVREFVQAVDSQKDGVDLPLLMFSGIMYFRPTGQSLATSVPTEAESFAVPSGEPELPPVAAILDGVPNLQHSALAGQLLLDDPENLSAEYQPGERRHGTAMASLVVHGDLNVTTPPLKHKVHHVPIMQPNPNNRNVEHVPEQVFLEDRIELAVRRLLDGSGNVPGQAAEVKLINLSVCDPTRPFARTPSPLARLLDWLCWKYRVLFCVSAGNVSDNIAVGMSRQQFESMAAEERTKHVLQQLDKKIAERRLLSPAESLNALTIGAQHTDGTGDFDLRHRIDLLPGNEVLSPISRVGHGFHRSVKPEVLFPGGRQLYHDTPSNGGYRN